MKIVLDDLIKRRRPNTKVSAEMIHLETEKAGEYLKSIGYMDYNREVFQAFASLMARCRRGVLQKGAVIMGPLGSGKTFGAECLAAYCGIEFCPANNLTDAYTTDPQTRGTFEKMAYPCILGNPERPRALILDELGREPIPLNHYGTKVNVLEAVLAERYRLYTRYGAKTIITTNLTMDQIAKIYGDYIRARLEEMCNIIAANGRDLRKRIQ